MIVEGKIRKWGNSFGISIPRNKAESNNLKEGDDVEVLLKKKSNVLRKTFSTLKFDEPIEKIMRETDEDLYPE